MGGDLSASLRSLASYSYKTADESFGCARATNLGEPGDDSSNSSYINMNPLADKTEAEEIREIEDTDDF